MWAEDAGGLRGIRGGAAGWTGQGGRGRSRRAPPAPVPQRGPWWRAGGPAPGGWARCPRTAGGSARLRGCKAMKETLATPVSGRRGARHASDSTDRRPDKGGPGGRTAVGSRADWRTFPVGSTVNFIIVRFLLIDNKVGFRVLWTY